MESGVRETLECFRVGQEELVMCFMRLCTG